MGKSRTEARRVQCKLIEVFNDTTDTVPKSSHIFLIWTANMFSN